MVSKRKFERKLKELITKEKGSIGKSQALAIGATIATIAVLEAQIAEAQCGSSATTTSTSSNAPPPLGPVNKISRVEWTGYFS